MSIIHRLLERIKQFSWCQGCGTQSDQEDMGTYFICMSCRRKLDGQGKVIE